jgi:hypothetical protein
MYLSLKDICINHNSQKHKRSAYQRVARQLTEQHVAPIAQSDLLGDLERQYNDHKAQLPL